MPWGVSISKKCIMVEVKLNSSQNSGLVRGRILHSGVGDHILYGCDLQGIDVLNAVTCYDLGVWVIEFLKI